MDEFEEIKQFTKVGYFRKVRQMDELKALDKQ
jgi:hypothetical protein